LLLIVIFKPPEGATDPMVTVAVLDFPPFTDVGLSVIDDRAGGLMVSVAD
jgi:hypothetical protein